MLATMSQPIAAATAADADDRIHPILPLTQELIGPVPSPSPLPPPKNCPGSDLDPNLFPVNRMRLQPATHYHHYNTKRSSPMLLLLEALTIQDGNNTLHAKSSIKAKVYGP